MRIRPMELLAACDGVAWRGLRSVWGMGSTHVEYRNLRSHRIGRDTELGLTRRVRGLKIEPRETTRRRVGTHGGEDQPDPEQHQHADGCIANVQ